MSRARDLADAGSKANFLDNVSADINTTYAPKASPAFTGTPTGITASHITTGTLGNTVQDNITRLGTVTSGTISSSVSDDITMEVIQAGCMTHRAGSSGPYTNYGSQLGVGVASDHYIELIGWRHPNGKLITSIEFWGYWPYITSMQGGLVTQTPSTNQSAYFVTNGNETKGLNDDSDSTDQYFKFDMGSYSLTRASYYYNIRIQISNSSSNTVYTRGMRINYS